MFEIDGSGKRYNKGKLRYDLIPHCLNEEVAKEFLGLSVDNIKSTINSNKREFEQFDAWVETLGEDVENQYDLLDNMVFAKTADDFIKLVESRKQIMEKRNGMLKDTFN
jgi:hypothetical protein